MILDRFIDLNRSFSDVTEGEDQEERAYHSYIRLLGDEPAIGWDTLLTSHVAVILGEPGSGKTWELQYRASILTKKGTPAFFVRLDDLVETPLDSVIPVEDLPSFHKWKRGNQRSVFFLDSVDESKVKKQTDFGKAIENFVRGVGLMRLRRTNIIISSRISDWRSRADEDELIDRLHLVIRRRDKVGRAEMRSELRIVELEPLDKERVRRFAEGSGLQTPGPFLNALDLHHAWEFARRPIDVAGLIGYWQEKGSLGTLTQLIEFDLDKRLRETQEKSQNDPLSPGEARLGAACLGAAVIFCRRFSFLIPDRVSVENLAVAMDASECLPPTWTPRMTHAMLSRGIFDAASYGRIRFHHRRTAEYLAAVWLAARMGEGCPYPVLEDLLFAKVDDVWYLRPSLRSVVAWLAPRSEPGGKYIRERVLSCAPELFLSEGDAESLPLDYKRSLLKSLILKYQNNDQIHLENDQEALSRLADGGLAEDIRSGLADSATPSNVKIILMELIRLGRLKDCIESVLHVVGSSTGSGTEIAYAVAAIRDMGDKESRLRLAKIALAFNTIDQGVASLLVEALFPQAIDAIGLVELLRKVKGRGPELATLPHSLERHMNSSLPEEQASEVLSQLLLLLEEAPHLMEGDEERPFSARFHWVAEVLHVPLLKLLKQAHLGSEDVAKAVKTLWLLEEAVQRHDMDSSVSQELNCLLRQHTGVLRSFLHFKVDYWHRRKSDEEMPYFYVFENAQVVLGQEGDLEWLLHEIRDETCREIRIVSLKIAIGLFHRFGQKRRAWKQIAKAIKGDTELRSIAKAEAGKGLLYWLRRKRRQYGERWAKRKLRAIRESFVKHYWKRRNQAWLVLNAKKIRSGSALLALRWLYNQAAEGGSSDQWGLHSLESLRAKWGKRVARAAADGWGVIWRRFAPLLPVEKPQPHETDIHVILGLSGINIGLSEGTLSLEALTAEEARLAAIYAVNEMNGFAEWLTDLARLHPGPVREVLSSCVRGEWKLPADKEHRAKTLSDLHYHGEGIYPLVTEVILDELRLSDPANYQVLETALSILLKLPFHQCRELTDLAARRAPSYAHSNTPFFILWMVIWLQLDAEAAGLHLRQVVSSSSTGTEIMVNVCGALSPLHTRSFPSVENPDYLRPTFLRRFIPLVYEYIREEDDIDRLFSKGSYSPTMRDHAQDFRNGLFNCLVKIPGHEAREVLKELSEEPRFARYRPWILRLYTMQAEAEADLKPWHPPDIRSFMAEHETNPHSDHDLFRIALKRLKGIKDGVERADISSRHDLHKDDDEPVLRSWLARQLRALSRNRYNVVQEEEIDLAQKPDLRVEATGMGPVSIEVKWGDHWSLADLRKGLIVQLAGQYLRAVDSNYGIYVVGHKGTKKYWEDQQTGIKLTFLDLVLRLQETAKDFVAQHKDVEDLIVISIDFSEPK